MGAAASSQPSMAPNDSTMPIVYDPNYNIKFYGLEKLHPFDSCKYEKVANMLIEDGIIDGLGQLVSPGRPVAVRELEMVHSPAYLRTVHSAVGMAQVCEAPALAYLPDSIVESHITTPMKWAVQGTVLAASLAMDYGWAINLGGGMHHAQHAQGGGWCAFADVFLAFLQLNRERPQVKKMLIVDLDVHQGNGFSHSKIWLRQNRPDLSVYIVDAFNPYIYPGCATAKAQIDCAVPVLPGQLTRLISKD